MQTFWRRGGKQTGDDQPLARRFTVLYLIAILLFAVFTLAVLRANGDTLAETNESTAELEAVSEQIVRVDTILHQAEDWAGQVDADDGEGAEVDANDDRLYREAIADLKLVQGGLLNGNEDLGLPGNPSDELEELWTGDAQLDQAILDFAADAGTIPGLLEGDEDSKVARDETLAEMQAATDPQSGSILPGLDQAVALYTEQVTKSVEHRQRFNQLAILAFFGLVGLVIAGLFRPMARAIQTETTNLRDAERIHRENNERQNFHNDLNQSLELAEDEDEVLAAVGRAMVDIIGDHRAELLLIDPSEAHLRQAQTNPAAGGAGCPVDSPEACAAIRRGQTVTYDTSRALNVCPKLSQHDDTPCSAICAPVMFIGKARGVLHMTGPDLVAPDPTMVERMNVLASETGNRIGTLQVTQQTELQASTDGLTGLPNRRSLESRARELISVRRPFSIAMADLDRFKDLNDTYGHEQGDRSLKLFAKTMRSNLRPDDVAARYGGEEFVLLLPNTSVDEAKQTLDRLRVTLSGEIASSGSVPFTASWGLSTSESGATFDEMMVAADEALYAAKRAGRNRVMVSPGAEGHEGPVDWPRTDDRTTIAHGIDPDRPDDTDREPDEVETETLADAVMREASADDAS